MRAHNHQIRAHTARAVAIALPRQDALLGIVAVGMAAVTVFTVLAAGWQAGGLLLQFFGMGA